MYRLTGPEDSWKTLPAYAFPEEAKLPIGPVIVPSPLWQARKSELIRREYDHGWPLGVWLASDEGIAVIERDIEDFSVIAIEFDRYSDGLGYENARILRQRGYRGQLRAFGDISGKIARLKHFGFDAFSTARPASGPGIRIAWAR